jgi:hypothetical protein
MTREDDFIGQLEGYLDEYGGLTPLPDATRHAVRAELPTTRQIGSLPGPMRYLSMSMSIPAPARYGLAAAVVIAAAVLGSALLINGPNAGGGNEATPTMQPSAAKANQGSLVAGSYFIDDPFPVGVTFVVPPGWRFEGGGGDEAVITTSTSQPGIGVGFSIIANVSVDPCDPDQTQLDPPVGASVEDLVAALSNLQGYEATAATDVTVSGFHGKEFVLTPDADNTECDEMRPWSTAFRVNGTGAGEVTRFRIVDVDGVRLAITGTYFVGEPTSAEMAELDRVLDSIQLEPR